MIKEEFLKEHFKLFENNLKENNLICQGIINSDTCLKLCPYRSRKLGKRICDINLKKDFIILVRKEKLEKLLS